MADGHFPTLISKDRNDNAATNPIFISLTDGTDTALVDGSGNLQVILAANDGVDIGDVTINNAAGASAVNIQDGGNSITVDGSVTVSATDLDIRDLSVTQDSILIYANTAKDGTGTDYVPLVDADGHLQVDILSGSASGTEYTEDDVAPAAATAPSIVVERDDALSTITPAEGDWTKLYANARGALWVELDTTNAVPVTDNGGSLTVDATDLDIRDLTSVSDSVEVLQDTHDDLNANANIQVGNTDVSAANPVPVTITDPGTSSTEVHDYDTSASVAAGATDTHTYTASGGVFLLRQVSAASSGGSKVEVKNAGSTIWVGFIPRRGGEINHCFKPAVEIADAAAVTVERTNRQLSAQDVYSTVEGNQL